MTEMVPGPPCARCGEEMPPMPADEPVDERYHVSCYRDAVATGEIQPPPEVERQEPPKRKRRKRA